MCETHVHHVPPDTDYRAARVPTAGERRKMGAARARTRRSVQFCAVELIKYVSEHPEVCADRTSAQCAELPSLMKQACDSLDYFPAQNSIFGSGRTTDPG